MQFTFGLKLIGSQKVWKRKHIHNKFDLIQKKNLELR